MTPETTPLVTQHVVEDIHTHINTSTHRHIDIDMRAGNRPRSWESTGRPAASRQRTHMGSGTEEAAEKLGPWLWWSGVRRGAKAGAPESRAGPSGGHQSRARTLQLPRVLSKAMSQHRRRGFGGDDSSRLHLWDGASIWPIPLVKPFSVSLHVRNRDL